MWQTVEHQLIRIIKLKINWASFICIVYHVYKRDKDIRPWKEHIKKFTIENNIEPSPVQEELDDLTQYE